MISFKFNSCKSLSAFLYVAKCFIDKKLKESPDIHSIFKILYFADREHLVSYGRPITGDFYIAMKNGPVPSNIYDVVKSVRGDSFFPLDTDYSQWFKVYNKFRIQPLADPDIEEFSESDLECLNSAFEKYSEMSFNKLTEISHGDAWSHPHLDDKISFIRMAREANATDEMIEYIENTAENSTLF